ncbi:hypothetical protein [Verrucosispora sp. WMMC514]|nr:hypothetical protein [Verrucosispora sp. WMMC514]WBB93341.1 hypothetical protein O7597_10365 [Verrucosispora sp. WMMC514]
MTLTSADTVWVARLFVDASGVAAHCFCCGVARAHSGTATILSRVAQSAP